MKGWLGCRARRRKGGALEDVGRGRVHERLRALPPHNTHTHVMSAPKTRGWVPVGLGSYHDGEHAKVEVRADVEAGGDADGAVVPRVLVRLLPLRPAAVQHHPAAVTPFGVSRDCAASRKREHHGLTV